MNAAPLTYRELQREVRKEAIRYALVRGQGGAVLFLWAVGVSVFWLGELLVYAAIWTAASLLICTLAVTSYLRNPRARTAATRSLLDARFPTGWLTEPRHREALRKGTEVCVELLAKVQTIRQSPGADGDELDAVPEAGRLLALQYESAKQAEEFHRILGLVSSITVAHAPARESARRGPTPHSADALALYEENIRAIEGEAGEAEDLVGVIADQLETLLLQVLRIERRTVDVVTGVETRRQSQAALERLQQTVDARRTAATWLLEGLAPGRKAAHRTDRRADRGLSGEEAAGQPTRAPRAKSDDESHREEG
jgi:hypothetical protein